MKMRSNKKLLSFILCMVLIVAAALFTNGCNGSTGNAVSSGNEAENADVQADSENSTESDSAGDVSVLGEGSTKFAFTVTDQDGNETGFEIHTDKETVGEALLEVGLIEGEESEYGLYVKADACAQCGHCESRCPFHVKQESRMREIAAYFQS